LATPSHTRWGWPHSHLLPIDVGGHSHHSPTIEQQLQSCYLFDVLFAGHTITPLLQQSKSGSGVFVSLVCCLQDASVDWASVFVCLGDVLQPRPSSAPTGAPWWYLSCVLVYSSVPLRILSFDLVGELCIGAEASIFLSPPVTPALLRLLRFFWFLICLESFLGYSLGVAVRPPLPQQTRSPFPLTDGSGCSYKRGPTY